MMVNRGPVVAVAGLAVLTMLAAVADAAEPNADCRADVTLSAAPSLHVDVVYRCRSDAPVAFRVANAAARGLVADVRDRRGNAVAPQEGQQWQVPADGGEAVLAYRIDIGALGRTADSIPVAVSRGRASLALLGTWLLQPQLETRDWPSIDIVPRAGPAELRLATGLPRHGEAWRLAGTSVAFAGYTALGEIGLHEIVVTRPGSLAPGARPATASEPLRLAILPGDWMLPAAELVTWVQRTAETQANFWDGFPAPGMLVTLVPRPAAARVGYGRVVPGGGATMAIEVGTRSSRAALYDDWVLVHEFIHSAMPFVTGRAGWLMEGVATWFEPIIRARAGWKSEADVWREWIESMPRGAAAFEQGIARGSGSVYWSGALFMLLADIEIRRATSGARGLEDCLRGVLREGGHAALRWPLALYIQRCDAALGGRYLGPLVDRFVERGERVDLAALWRSLGVSLEGGVVRFDETAPLAAIRRQIVMGNPARPQRRVSMP
jgi:hypothetical protein